MTAPPTTPGTVFVRLLTIALLGAGMVAFGLWVDGPTDAGANLLPGRRTVGGLEPMPGSRWEGVEEVEIDGVPHRTLACTIDLPADAVIDHYRAFLDQPPTPGDRPTIQLSGSAAGVSMLGLRDGPGELTAVIAMPTGSHACRYYLIRAQGPTAGTQPALPDEVGHLLGTASGGQPGTCLQRPDGSLIVVSDTLESPAMARTGLRRRFLDGGWEPQPGGLSFRRDGQVAYARVAETESPGARITLVMRRTDGTP